MNEGGKKALPLVYLMSFSETLAVDVVAVRIILDSFFAIRLDNVNDGVWCFFL